MHTAIKITAKYKSSRRGFKKGQRYILFPETNSDCNYKIHTGYSWRVYKSAEEFLAEWEEIELYTYKTLPGDLERSRSFITDYLKIIN